MAAWFIALGVLANIFAVGLVVVRKVRRDHRETVARVRRSAMRSAAVDGGAALDPVLEDAARQDGARRDLLTVLTSADLTPEQQLGLRAAAHRRGLGAILATQLRDRRPARRGMAVMLLAALGGPLAAAVIASALADDDIDVRLAAARALGDLPGTAAAHALVDAVLGGRLPYPRLVERLGHPDNVPTLLAALQRPLRLSQRVAFVQALGLAGAAAAEHDLVLLLMTGAAEERAAAARALLTCGTRRTVPSLVQAMEDRFEPVRTCAAQALGRLGDDEVVEVLERALRDRAWWVRARAAEALAQLGPAGIAALVDATHGADRFAGDRAREALAVHAMQAIA